MTITLPVFVLIILGCLFLGFTAGNMWTLHRLRGSANTILEWIILLTIGSSVSSDLLEKLTKIAYRDNLTEEDNDTVESAIVHANTLKGLVKTVKEGVENANV